VSFLCSCTRLLLAILAVSADSCAEVSLKDARLQIDGAPPGNAILSIALPEVHALAPLPGLDAEEEQECSDEDDRPFPADTLVPEDGVVDDGNVQDREDGDESEDDGEEEELVAPDVNGPLREVLLGVGLHHEERAAHVQHLPCQEDGEPGKAGESGRTSAEDSVASVVERFVAAVSEVAISEAKHDQGERAETESGNPKTVNEHVEDDLDGENTALELRFVSINAKSQSQQGKLTF